MAFQRAAAFEFEYGRTLSPELLGHFLVRNKRHRGVR